ncbi:MAG TPA: hypothetical protein VGD37_17225 [Kofleriaceae bacterium]
MARSHLPLTLVVLAVARMGSAAPDKAPVVLPAEAQADIARRLIHKADCTGHVAQLSTALDVAGERLTPDERIQGFVLLQHCAKDNKSWHTLIAAAAYLLVHAPTRTNAEDVIEAYLKLGDDRHAAEMLKLIVKGFPAQRANMTIAASLIACHKSDFQLCFNASGKMLDVLARDKATSRKATFENQIFHAFSAAALGKYDVYDADMKQIDAVLAGPRADPGKLDAFRTIVESARAARLFIDTDHTSELALGTYHLIAGGKIKNLDNADALVTLRLINQEPRLRTVTVTVEVPGVTDAATETISLPPGKQVNRRMSPPLKIGFDVARLRAARASQIALHIVDPKTHASLLDQMLPIQILPRDSLPLHRKTGADDTRPTFDYAAAWVTPNAPEIDAFITRAKARLTGGFSGMQRDTLPQVKALFDELKAHGVTYVEDPRIFDERGQVQRTRLPAEVLASTNAQCLEGTLLYASLLEAIGMHPVLVFKTGHAFLAWRPSKYDRTRSPFYFLETTMTGGPATFEQAMEYATKNFVQTAAERQFELGIGALLDITELRLKGYTAQPY